ncbi:hypothetical protein BDW67DRAFT_69391 [Aspergillus spinulosporus]
MTSTHFQPRHLPAPQNARPGLRLICGFLTTLPPLPLPPDVAPFRPVDDEAVNPSIFLPATAGLRTTDPNPDLPPPTSTSFLRLDNSVFSFSRCFSAAARSRSAAICDSISMRRLNSCSVTRRSR